MATAAAAGAAATTTTSTLVSAVTPPVEAVTQQQHCIQMLHHSATSGGMPHGLGLLTTVASLPPKYRSRYLSINTKSETPLDLSVKPFSPQIANDVPIATSFTEVYTEPSSEPEPETEPQPQTDDEEYTTLTNAPYETLETIEVAHTVVITTEPVMQTTNVVQRLVNENTKAPMTPPLTPTKRKLSDQCSIGDDGNNLSGATIGSSIIKPEVIVERIIADRYTNPAKMAKTNDNPTIKREITPTKPIRATDSAPKTVKAQPPQLKHSKNKATRKLKFDEETSSPVSGTIIRPLEDITDGTVQYSNGDIDPKYNIVEITEETKAELAAIKNVIGDYICRLCRLKFDDAFGLAQHRCACIVLLEYRCPECGKQFNCPANLASHRRWHKPKKDGNSSQTGAKKENRNTTNAATRPPAGFPGEKQTKRAEPVSTAAQFSCGECGKKFKRQAYLRKHQLTHAGESKKSAMKTSNGVSSSSTTSAVVAARSNGGVTYQSYAGSSSSAPSLSSSSSSLHSYSGASVGQDDDVGAVYVVNSVSAGNYNSNSYDYDDGDSMSDCSNSSTGYGRLQIVESGLTEEENIAAAALTNLRNCASVIQHTTLAH